MKDFVVHPWTKNHSDNFHLMVSRAERIGILEHPDGYGSRTGDCGDTVTFYLSVHAGRLQMITFTVDGCANTVACGNTVSYLMEGRLLSDGWELTPENVVDFLQTLPEDHFHCAELAVGAFYRALTDYSRRDKERWKKVYQGR